MISSSQHLKNMISAAKKPMLVMFHAPWCGPCRKMKPVIESIKKEYSDRLNVAQIDIENDKEAMSQFFITNLPTFIVFVDGRPVKRFTGVRTKSDLSADLSTL